MVKIFPYLAGETLNSHKAFLNQLPIKHVHVVDSYTEGAVVIVFCPIVSRFETDITTALSKAKDNRFNEVILVAMHHTFNETYQVPNHGGFQHRDVRLLVDCLFFNGTGLLDCPKNKEAVKKVSKELKSLKSLQPGSLICCKPNSMRKKICVPQGEENRECRTKEDLENEEFYT